ncbi:SDR family oxidoreductase [Longimicrobium terrae]|uniref:Short-subunit dehydrogenase n=1 Tax=Longimicrobium terrae TaxID=1639882 RepID=A0A841H523_9BACT|nr:SDR family oxidoreductase [Longimicrobium terrae]MBB4638891.1 short-subunit dehydrogenase [Longimicrobium terrae]MBB6073130.1 short-subunit dehydrogenase [Longimicrobium terrae]NNC30183.1 SDR family oxidoreductase [Longimicrobium terrae]
MARPPFRGNVVVITGASDGIGAEMALQLATQGARIVLAARDEAKLQAVAARCRQLGGQTLVVPTDVAVQAQCETLMERAVAEFGRIDTLVNNAGISMWARFDELTTLEPFERMMRVNYMGSVYCTWYALPHLKKSRGRIVGVSSLTGRAGVPTRSGYAATKHAMAGFFDSLRIELADEGVTVTMVYPGFVSTAIRERAMGPDGTALESSPVHEARVMTPEECARIIIAAMAGRRREVVMTARAKVGQWIKLIAPGVVDRIARRAIERGE